MTKLADQFHQIQNSKEENKELLLQKATELAEKAKTQNEPKLEFDIYLFMGRSHRFQGDAFKALDTLNKAFILLNSRFPHESSRLAYLYREYCNTYANSLNEYNMAIDYCLKGYKLNIKELNSVFLNNLGSINISLEQFDKAEEYLNEARTHSKNNYLMLSFIEHNFGLKNRLQKNYDLSLDYYNKSIKRCEEYTTDQSIGKVDKESLNYISCYSYLDIVEILKILGDFKSAEKALSQAKNIATKSNQSRILSQVFLTEGKILLAQGKTKTFKELFATSKKYCQKHLLLVDIQEWYTLIQEVYENEGALRKALDISKEWIANKKEITGKLNTINLSALLVSKEKQILSLENRNRIMQLQKEELEQFAYIVTHDLKTPLSHISNFAGLFSKKYYDIIDTKGKEYLNFIMNSSVDLNSMLTDLLQFITLEIEETQLPLENVENVLNEIITKNQHKEKEDLEIVFKNLPDLPMRKFHLNILFDNLISNAYKFKSPDENSNIIIDGIEKEDEYVYTISDNGIGIEENHQDTVFGIFKRLSKTKGTGMGLAICKKIVQTYSGHIWITENEPNGCHFHFKIKKTSSTPRGITKD